jgi:hypothetical protein
LSIIEFVFFDVRTNAYQLFVRLKCTLTIILK